MKKGFVVFTMMVFLGTGCFILNAAAQQAAAPPLLVQPNQAPPASPLAAVTPPTPSVAVTPPVPPPAPASRILQPVAPPPYGPRVTVVQTILVQALLADLPKAEATVRQISRQLTPGKVWIMRAPGGGIRGTRGQLVVSRCRGRHHGGAAESVL